MRIASTPSLKNTQSIQSAQRAEPNNRGASNESNPHTHTVQSMPQSILNSSGSQSVARTPDLNNEKSVSWGGNTTRDVASFKDDNKQNNFTKREESIGWINTPQHSRSTIKSKLLAIFLLALVKNSGQFSISPKKLDGIVTDSLSLLSIPEGNLSDNLKGMKALEPGGIFVGFEKRDGKQVFTVTTPNKSVLELRRLTESDASGFHATALAVHEVKNGVADPRASTIKIALGGTSNSKDWARTIAMHLTKNPQLVAKQPGDFLKQALKAYEEAYQGKRFTGDIAIAGHSAGAPAAMKVFELIRKLLPKSTVSLSLYEPFGAEFIKYNATDHNQTTTYVSAKSFLTAMKKDGAAVGEKVVVPPSDNKDCKGPIDAHGMLCIFEAAVKHGEKNPLNIHNLSDKN